MRKTTMGDCSAAVPPAPVTESAEAPPGAGRSVHPDVDVHLLAWAVTNCHTLARRALSHAPALDSYHREKWEHVQRICEKAGARSAGVLRASVPTEITDGSEVASSRVPPHPDLVAFVDRVCQQLTEAATFRSDPVLGPLLQEALDYRAQLAAGVPSPAVERCQVWVPGYPRRRCGADARTQVRTADGDVLTACAACAAKLGAAASRVPPHPEQEHENSRAHNQVVVNSPAGDSRRRADGDEQHPVGESAERVAHPEQE